MTYNSTDNINNNQSNNIESYSAKPGTTGRFTDNRNLMSRYLQLREIRESDGATYDETLRRVTIPFYEDDIYYEVNSVTVNRLDVVASSVYGTPLLWWVIAYASEIDDPLYVPIGTILRIPQKARLYTTGGISAWLNMV